MARKPRNPIDETMDMDSSAYGTDSRDSKDTDTSNEKDERHPTYKKFPESRIPISKAQGKLWKSRFDQAVSKLKTDGTHDAWDEAVAYYKNDQTNKRNRDDPDSPSVGPEKDIAGGAFSRTENIVFSNVSSMVPAIYAKNPDVSIQSNRSGDESRQFASAAQKLVRTLLQKRTPPGINLKPKARVGVVRTTLMNISYIEVGYTKREVSSDAVMQDIDEIADKLVKAKSQKEITELEGQLQALDEKVDLLQPSGPWARAVHPKDIIIDPDASLPDLSDAKWIMVHDVLDTAYLNAVYRLKDGETGEWRSIFKPTHVVKRDGANTNMKGHDDDITNFSLFTYDDDTTRGYRDYGYDDERTYSRAQRTFVWRVWDKVTRRIYMFAENDWSWPIWVWDDPYGLDDFFMQFPLAFHTDPEDIYARGEVSYYLDQQDEINLINSQIARMRWRISNQLVANKRAVKDEESIMALIKPVKGQEIVTIDIPEGMKITDVVMAPPIPSVEYAQLFDKKNLLEAIDRVSGVSAVLRNVEFKTNTTNKAIDTYESSTQQRLDEKIDSIEEQIGRIGYALLVMCLQFMTQDEVAKLIGESAATWPPPMSAREAQDAFSLTVTGGSSLKPTSKVRKAQAQELGQILGQFGSSQPLAFYIALKVFARAYSDELVIDPSDWQMVDEALKEQIMGQIQGGPEGAQPGAGGPAAAPPQQAPQGQPPQQAGPPGNDVIMQLEQMLQGMPEEIRQQVGQAIGEGVPLTEILAKLQQMMQGGQPTGPNVPQPPPTVQ